MSSRLPQAVEKTICLESGGYCANPRCSNPRLAWVGEEGYQHNAVIAHVYDESQSSPKRKKPAAETRDLNDEWNLLVLCDPCSRRIDRPDGGTKYPAETLLAWKAKQEEDWRSLKIFALNIVRETLDAASGKNWCLLNSLVGGGMMPKDCSTAAARLTEITSRPEWQRLAPPVGVAAVNVASAYSSFVVHWTQERAVEPHLVEDSAHGDRLCLRYRRDYEDGSDPVLQGDRKRAFNERGRGLFALVVVTLNELVDASRPTLLPVEVPYFQLRFDDESDMITRSAVEQYLAQHEWQPS